MHLGEKGTAMPKGLCIKGECLTCEERRVKSVYIGETGKSTYMYVRGSQYYKAMNNPIQYKDKNAFAKHIVEKHEGQNASFKFSKIATFRKPLERQVREGKEILRMEADVMMNSKQDHYRPAIRRMAPTDLLEDS